eukprot:scaffold101793_cov61-Attheya_sp.AAC.4
MSPLGPLGRTIHGSQLDDPHERNTEGRIRQPIQPIHTILPPQPQRPNVHPSGASARPTTNSHPEGPLQPPHARSHDLGNDQPIPSPSSKM